jgi:hypothetical protein
VVAVGAGSLDVDSHPARSKPNASSRTVTEAKTLRVYISEPPLSPGFYNIPPTTYRICKGILAYYEGRKMKSPTSLDIAFVRLGMLTPSMAIGW